jgi:hypothetical protein
MPCYDPRSDEKVIQYVPDFESIKELNTRTADLCKVMNMLEKADKELYNKVPKRIREWHTDHKKWDKERKK